MRRSTALLAAVLCAVFTSISALQAAPPEVEQAVEQILSEPLWEAVTEGDPAQKEGIRKRLLDAYDRGGENAFFNELRDISAEYGQANLLTKMPYARDADILDFWGAYVSIGRKLESEDPVLCYKWAYGAQYNDPPDLRVLSEVIGPALDRQIAFAMVALIKNAAADPVQYDRGAAQLSIQSAAAAVLSRIDQGSLQVIAGVRPASSFDEMRNTCKATADLYAYLLGVANAADSFRELFRPQEAQISHLGGGGQTAIRQVFKNGDPENVFAGKDLGLSNALR